MDVRTGNIYESTCNDDHEKGTGDTLFKLSGDNCTDYCRLASKFCCICIKKRISREVQKV